MPPQTGPPRGSSDGRSGDDDGGRPRDGGDGQAERARSSDDRSGDDGGGRPREGSDGEPEGEGLETLYASYVRMPLLITLPPRHLVCTAILYLLGARYPGLWGHEDFCRGTAEAVSMVFACLAAEEPSQLDGIVGEALLARFARPGESGEAASSGDSADAPSAGAASSGPCATASYGEVERWAAPPSMLSAKVVGILSCGGVEATKDQGRRFHVTPVMYTQEEYSFEGGPERLIHHRLQHWTFERSIEEDGHWQLVDTDGDWCLRREEIKNNTD